MIQLYDLGNGIFEIQSEQYGSYKSSADLVFRKAIRWGISLSELERAVESLIQNEHDYADFGMMKTFIFSKRLRKAS